METTRPPPPQGTSPPYTFISRFYRRSLRPVIFFITGVSAIWSLLWAVGWFKIYAGIGAFEHNLAGFALGTAILHAFVFLIESFGFFAAYSQRLRLIRIYAFGSVLTVLLILAASLIRTIVHFGNKNELINDCITFSMSTDNNFRWSGFASYSGETLTRSGATSWCQEWWSRDSFSEIFWVIFKLLITSIFSSVAFAYYRQCLDPTSPANASFRGPARADLNAYPTHYNPPYNADVPSLPYDAPRYAPPPGPPPAGDAKPPAYSLGSGPDYDAQGKFNHEKDDPFADFEGPSRTEERDVTSQRRVGEEGGFHV